MTCTCDHYVPNPQAPADVVIARRDARCPKHGDERVYVVPMAMRMRGDAHAIREYTLRDETAEAFAAIEATLDEMLAVLQRDNP